MKARSGTGHPTVLLAAANRDDAQQSSYNKTRRSEMAELDNEFKKELSVKWIKAESGNTYLCPVESLKRLKSPSESELKTICVDESANPQTD
jgi:hypothetical protein